MALSDDQVRSPCQSPRQEPLGPGSVPMPGSARGFACGDSLAPWPAVPDPWATGRAWSGTGRPPGVELNRQPAGSGDDTSRTSGPEERPARRRSASAARTAPGDCPGGAPASASKCHSPSTTECAHRCGLDNVMASPPALQAQPVAAATGSVLGQSLAVAATLVSRDGGSCKCVSSISPTREQPSCAVVAQRTPWLIQNDRHQDKGLPAHSDGHSTIRDDAGLAL
jgi:hypothetical protein